MLPLLTRLFVWGIIFGVLTLLGSFFTLIFLTFVFAYLQSSIVDMLARYAPRRRTSLVILTGSLFLTIVIGMSVFLAPQVYQQASGFAKGFSSYMARIDTELLTLAERYPMLQDAIPELRKPVQATPPDWAVVGGQQPEVAVQQRAFRDSPTGLLVGILTGKGEATDVRETLKVVLDQLANVSRLAIGMLTTFLLALLFSFLIVLDLPNLAGSVRELEKTRLRFIYVEAADNIYQFGKVLGHAMQAQFYIACINTLLTGVGLYLLGMGEQVAFLSVIVFLCSFIPVAGVFISSVPICLIALNTGGLDLVLMCIGVITFTHLLEGYVLNPLIYGARLRINPVIVLIILTIGGKLFHLWGLILGVPVCTYVFGHAIRYTSPGNRLFVR
jgi:predicted PurR-regulated permease PerM